MLDSYSSEVMAKYGVVDGKYGGATVDSYGDVHVSFEMCVGRCGRSLTEQAHREPNLEARHGLRRR